MSSARAKRSGDEIALLPPACTSAPEELKRRLTLGFEMLTAGGMRASARTRRSRPSARPSTSTRRPTGAPFAMLDAPEAAASSRRSRSSRAPARGGAEAAKAAGLAQGKLSEQPSSSCSRHTVRSRSSSRATRPLSAAARLAARPQEPRAAGAHPAARAAPRDRVEITGKRARRPCARSKAACTRATTRHGQQRRRSPRAGSMARHRRARARSQTVLALETLGRAGNYYLIEPHIPRSPRASPARGGTSTCATQARHRRVRPARARHHRARARRPARRRASGRLGRHVEHLPTALIGYISGGDSGRRDRPCMETKRAMSVSGARADGAPCCRSFTRRRCCCAFGASPAPPSEGLAHAHQRLLLTRSSAPPFSPRAANRVPEGECKRPTDLIRRREGHRRVQHSFRFDASARGHNRRDVRYDRHA